MENKLLELSYTLDTIADVIPRFWEVAKRYNTLAFSGEMGAGKTTFIHTLCDYLKVQDSVSSPTFALINEYHFNDEEGKDTTIYHLDWYRLRDTADAISAGMEDCIISAQRGQAYCFVEWPEKAQALLREPYLWIRIDPVEMYTRQMEVIAIP